MPGNYAWEFLLCEEVEILVDLLLSLPTTGEKVKFKIISFLFSFNELISIQLIAGREDRNRYTY